MNHYKCRQIYINNKWKVTESHLCAGYDEGGRDACRGDSGGPLVCGTNSQYTLAGIVSWGSSKCGYPRMPQVFTAVSYYLDFVKAGIAEAEFTNGINIMLSKKCKSSSC